MRVIVLELLLLVASVFVFRAMWSVLDAVPWFHTPEGLAASLVVGFVVTVACLAQLNRTISKVKN